MYSSLTRCSKCRTAHETRAPSYELQLDVREDSSIQSLISKNFGRKYLPDTKCTTCRKAAVYRKTALKDPSECLIVLLKRCVQKGRNITKTNYPVKVDLEVRLKSEDEYVEIEADDGKKQPKLFSDVPWYPMSAEKAMNMQQIINLGEVESKYQPEICDGNCLFRSVCSFVFGKEDKQDLLRIRTVSFLDKCFDRFISCLKNKEISQEDYIDYAKESTSHGTGVELWAISTLFRCCVFVFSNDLWSLYEPLFDYSTFIANGTTCYIIKKSKTNYQDSERLAREGAIFLNYSATKHFSPANTPSQAMKMAGRLMENKEPERPLDFYKPVTFSPEKKNEDFIRKKKNENSIPQMAEQPKPSETATVYEYDEKDEPVYTLTAAITHHGNSPYSGHYTCFSFDTERNEWLHCDDGDIVRVTEDQVLREANREGYIFMYRRRHHGDTKEFAPAGASK